MRRTLFLLSFLLLVTVNGQRSMASDAVPVGDTFVPYQGYADSQSPIGEGEESSSKDKDVTEDDDDAGIDHRWLSREQSVSSDLHFLYQEILFRDLDLSVVIPPPKS